jgi:mono/diheme cytochrome c family protein
MKLLGPALAILLMGQWAGPVRADEPKLAGPGVAEDYALHCSACHTAEGGGTPGLVPSLRELAPLLALPGGREYLVRVPGVAQAPLSPDRIARLLNWVLAQYSGLAVEPRYSAEEVEVLRRSPLRDPIGFRAALVAASGIPSTDR